MLTEKSEVFLQVSRDSEKRVLHPGFVSEVEGDDFTAEFPPEDFEVSAQQEVAIYYRLNGAFVRQNARIVDVFEEDDEDEAGNATIRLFLDIEWTSEYEVVESRQSYRVSTPYDDVEVSFAGAEGCKMADISVTGFAVFAKESHEVGCDMKVTIDFDGDRASGNVRIQSKQQLRDETFRYSVHCVEAILQDDVQRICMAIQRTQLRREAVVDS